MNKRDFDDQCARVDRVRELRKLRQHCGQILNNVDLARSLGFQLPDEDLEELNALVGNVVRERIKKCIAEINELFPDVTSAGLGSGTDDPIEVLDLEAIDA